MKYYLERNGLVNNEFVLDDEKFYSFFYDIYQYFESQGYFIYAFEGVNEYNFGNIKVLEQPSMSPSPRIYFMKQLGNTEYFPLKYFYGNIKKEEVFTIIEILHNHIAKINWNQAHTTYSITREEQREEFREHINNILKYYDKGYFLSEKNMIIELPEDALLEVIEKELPEATPDDVIEKVDTAIKMFFRFDSNIELKKKSINILADILEPLRKNINTFFASDMMYKSKDGDKLIFEIVNRFNIRHNDDTQVKEYSKDIWYDWMAHFYLSTIHAYYQLLEKHSID